MVGFLSVFGLYHIIVSWFVSVLENLAVFIIKPERHTTVSHLAVKMETADFPEYQKNSFAPPPPPHIIMKEAYITVLAVFSCV